MGFQPMTLIRLGPSAGADARGSKLALLLSTSTVPR